MSARLLLNLRRNRRPMKTGKRTDVNAEVLPRSRARRGLGRGAQLLLKLLSLRRLARGRVELDQRLDRAALHLGGREPRRVEHGAGVLEQRRGLVGAAQRHQALAEAALGLADLPVAFAE